MDPTIAFMAGAIFGGGLVLATVVSLLRIFGGPGDGDGR